MRGMREVMRGNKEAVRWPERCNEVKGMRLRGREKGYRGTRTGVGNLG